MERSHENPESMPKKYAYAILALCLLAVILNLAILITDEAEPLLSQTTSF